MSLQRAQHRVLAAGQLGGDVVRQLDLRPHPLSARRAAPAPTRACRRRGRRRAAIACFIATPMSFARLRAALAHRLLDDLPRAPRRRAPPGGSAPISSRLGLLAVGEILASGLAVGPSRPPGGACARGAAPPARHRAPSLAAFCSSESTRRSAPDPLLLAGAHRALQVGLDLLELSPSSAQDTPARAAAVVIARRAVSDCRAGPGAEASRPNSSATFQSTSRRSLRPKPGHQQQVVGARDEPRRQSAPADAQRDRDGLVVPELGHDALAAVAKRRAVSPLPSVAATLRATRRPWRIACCAVGGQGCPRRAGSGTAAQSPIAQTPLRVRTRIARASCDRPPRARRRPSGRPSAATAGLGFTPAVHTTVRAGDPSRRSRASRAVAHLTSAASCW